MEMDPEIGDIVDCRTAPSLEHFIIILGTRKKRGKEEVMYYIVTSRVYAVFKDILDFFNDCIDKNYQRFFHKFSKEKGKPRITPHGKLRDAFFFDHEMDYSGCLETDSMIVMNADPYLMDREAFDELHKNKMAKYKGMLTNADLVRLVEMVKFSDNIAKESRDRICENYNAFRKNRPQSTQKKKK